MSFSVEIERSLSSPSRRLGTMEAPLSVGDLTELIKTHLERSFEEVVVVGEVSNFKAHPSGHYYFSLKDARAVLNAVIFKNSQKLLRFKLEDGLKVIAVGRLTVYPPRGNYQIVIHRLEPDGLGALQLAFEQLKKKLEVEGLFDSKRKRPIPQFPQKVGIVTAPSGAAIRDILNILNRRFSGLHVLLYPVRVQGEGAAEEIAEAIEHLNAFFPELETLIVGRGGGSIEDLWAFNEEVVARAIYHSKIPMISAIGHEIDFTIADFVADLRAPTPSAAAELVVSHREDALRHVDHLVKRLLQVEKKVDMARMQLDDWTHRLHQFVRTIFEKKVWQVEHLTKQLELLNPKTIMSRGYSIVRHVKTLKVIKKASEIHMGEKLLIEFSKGKITAKV